MYSPNRSFIKLIDWLLLEITCVDCICLRVKNGRHLEEEALVWGWWSSYHLVGAIVKEVGVFEELSWKATEDQDILVVSLSNSCSLSVSEHLLWNLDHLPFVSIWGIILFNWVDILSCLVCNSAEYEDSLIIETTWTVIMSTNVEIWHFKPKINIWIVHLTLYLRLVLLLSGSWNNDELVSEPACRMTMSWVLHWVSFDEREVIVCLDLIHWIKSVFIFLVVTTTNHIELTLCSIDALEVVREWCLVFQPCHFCCLIQEVTRVKSLGIFLKQVALLNWGSAITISTTKSRCLWLGHHLLSWWLESGSWLRWNHWLLHLLSLLASWWINRSFVAFIAFSLGLMCANLFVWESFFASVWT